MDVLPSVSKNKMFCFLCMEHIDKCLEVETDVPLWPLEFNGVI